MWTIAPFRVLVAGLMTASVFVTARPAHANLIQNGSFSTGTFDYWTASGDVQPTTGQAVFNAGDMPPNGVLKQNIATIAGRNYSLNFLFGWGSYNGQGQSITASVLNGTTVLATLFASPPYADSYTSGGNRPFGVGFVATSSTTTIRFDDYAGNNTYSSDSSLSGVDVEVPEPVSFAVLAFGIVATLLGQFKRRTPMA